MAENKHKAFVDAVRARGGVKFYDLGGGVNLAVGAPPAAPTSGATTQGGLIGSLTPQNQYQATLAPTTSLNYTPVVNAAANNALAGYGQAQGNIANEQALAQQFIAQGQGQGPNPAQAQLAQNTGANVANQAAMAAGQRGASSNVGLIARQAGQQGAATQQQAVGQAATLQAQQELASQQAAAAQQQAIGQQIAQQQAASSQLFGTGAGAANTQNANVISNYANTQGINAATSAANAQAGQATSGGLLGGVGSALGSIGSMFGLAEGGVVSPLAPVPQMADGGSVGSVAPTTMGPQSYAGKFLSGLYSPEESTQPNLKSAGSAAGSGVAQGIKGLMPSGSPAAGAGATDLPDIGAAFLASKGGKVPAMLSPGEIYLSPSQAKEVATGKKSPEAGQKIHGKAKVAGDSLKNDTVPKVLEAGGVVVKRTMADDPDKARAFVQSVLAKQGMKRSKK